MAVRKARGLIFVGINTAEFLAVSIGNGDQPVMMFAAAIPVESGFVFFRGALGGALSHVAILFFGLVVGNYYKQMKNTQVPLEVLTGNLLDAMGRTDAGTLEA